MKQFHGTTKKRSFFEGWYLKHQNDKTSICLIPAFHVSSAGEKTLSIQVITPKYSGSASYPVEQFLVNEEVFSIQIEKNHFSETGIAVDLQMDDFYVRGSLAYGPLTRLQSDIMGPFSHIPFLKCNHGVLSMSHTLQGSLDLNGTEVDFSGGTGYIEKDWGTSFPQSYLWTQGCFPSPEDNRPCSVMLSVAHIPFLGFSFTGCISAIWYEGREYRLATYKGVRILRYTKTEVILEQKQYQLHVKLLSPAPRPLKAPAKGDMTRTIHESAACSVRYLFTANEETVFDVTLEDASFEYGSSQVDS